jgi:hypothetical protein
VCSSFKISNSTWRRSRPWNGLKEQFKPADPRNGKSRDWHSFKIYMSYGHVEHMLYENAEECKSKWEELINSMEAAGH